MKKLLLAFLLIPTLSIMTTGCSQKEKHFLKDENYRNKVHEQFLKRKDMAAGRSQQLFSVFDQESLSLEQREALEFLYAYMPLSDLADYDGNFFLGQVDAAFKAREYFDWGKKIPDDVFRHFVLVYRVNNENLDTARQVFFDELKDRVKGMTMEQAVLEVNHWCHEKVTYRGTDGRTSAPLALARTSWGRCGEESTFTTAALRAVGIPARQCYTPRWVHTDDNHAWVEAWVDGQWHYIGACEPEPKLDFAWFDGPVKRAMMVHTNVFGLYDGPEEKNVETDLYSVINLLGNYTTTRPVKVKVVNESGNPVSGADVRFKVYNYAEFYSIASTKTQNDGTTSIISGMGDLLVWASSGDLYGYGKSGAKDSLITVTLSRKPGEAYDETIVMNPPVQISVPELTQEEIASNAQRLAHEDSIRNAYMATFVNEADSRKFAEENKLNADQTWKYLYLSQGNWKDIKAFIENNKSNPYVFDFLASLTEKDLRDTPADYLQNYIAITDSVVTNKIVKDYINYVASPRIGNELIRPWRSFFKSIVSEEMISSANKNPQYVVDYIRSNIKLNNEDNYYNCPLSPQGSYELKIADKRSRDILFVALCRSLGILSRIDGATARPQYCSEGKWVDVFFEHQAAPSPKGSVIFNNDNNNIVKAAYGTHYTIARYENGDFTTLDFNGSDTYPYKEEVDAGYYRLMIGSRANDGSVTISTSYFTVGANETKSFTISLPKPEGRIQVQGIVDMNTKIVLKDGTEKSLKELANGKGMIICFSDPDKEPTKHILQDLPAVKSQIDSWGGGMLFSIPNDKLSKAFNASAFENLPTNSYWSVDNDRALLNAATGALQIEFGNNFPLVVYLNSNGGILFSSQGYRIGIGENIIQTIELEKESMKTVGQN